MVNSVFQLLVIGIVVLLLLIIEYLDWQGRLDIIKDRHPRLWGAMNSRPARLILLVLCLVGLSKDFRDAISIAPPPIVVVKAPPAPSIIVQPKEEHGWVNDPGIHLESLRAAAPAVWSGSVMSLKEEIHPVRLKFVCHRTLDDITDVRMTIGDNQTVVDGKWNVVDGRKAIEIRFRGPTLGLANILSVQIVAASPVTVLYVERWRP